MFSIRFYLKVKECTLILHISSNLQNLVLLDNNVKTWLSLSVFFEVIHVKFVDCLKKINWKRDFTKMSQLLLFERSLCNVKYLGMFSFDLCK